MALEEVITAVSLVTATLVFFFECVSGCLLLNCLFCQNMNTNMNMNMNIDIDIDTNMNMNIDIDIDMEIKILK